MGRKIFISYKHGDRNIAFLPGYRSGTARDYVDYLVGEFQGEEIYKGEGDEDLSEFKNETIQTHLKKKIHDSSITLVLISPDMKDSYKPEKDQWIPWEISYSLKEITRGDKMSHTNAVLAVVLPDRYGSYSYYINKCNQRLGCTNLNFRINTLFQILQDNMFNYNHSHNETCEFCGAPLKAREESYIQSVAWSYFIEKKDYWLDSAVKIRDNRRSYDITKEING